MTSRTLIAVLLTASLLLAGCASEDEPQNVEGNASTSSSTAPVEAGPASFGEHVGFSDTFQLSGSAPRASAICGGPFGECQPPAILDLTTYLPGPGIYELTYSIEEFQVLFDPAMDGAIVVSFNQVTTNGQSNVTMRWIQPPATTAGLAVIAFNNLANPESLNPEVDFQGEAMIRHLGALPVGSSFLLEGAPGLEVNFTVPVDAVLDFNLLDPAGEPTEDVRVDADTVRLPTSGQLLLVGITAPIEEIDAGTVTYVPLREAIGPTSDVGGGHRSEIAIDGMPVFFRVWFTTENEPVSFSQGYQIRVLAGDEILAQHQSECLICQLTAGGAARYAPFQSSVLHGQTDSVRLEVDGEGTMGVNAYLEVFYFDL